MSRKPRFSAKDLHHSVLGLKDEMSSISFSSIVAFSTAEGSAFYGVSKCAVAGLSDGLRKEVEPLGIKIMVGEPGPFKTDFFTDPLLSINTILKTTKIQIGKEKSE